MAFRARCVVRAGDTVSAARDYWPAAGAAALKKMSVRDKRLYLEDLTVSFDGFKALNKLTLYVEPGEMLCIIGPNGAGKTTMMDVITGKTRPDSGPEGLALFETLELALAGNRSFLKTLRASITAAQQERINEVLDIIGLSEQRG